MDNFENAGDASMGKTAPLEDTPDEDIRDEAGTTPGAGFTHAAEPTIAEEPVDEFRAEMDEHGLDADEINAAIFGEEPDPAGSPAPGDPVYVVNLQRKCDRQQALAMAAQNNQGRGVPAHALCAQAEDLMNWLDGECDADDLRSY